MADATLSKALVAEQGLTGEEYERIVTLLGREPNLTEVGLFGALWSEHCSYKSSKVYLKSLPTTGPRILQGPGENAGVVDVGEGVAIVFKMESHNHPSFIEPYQGAATGVGGIIRDIFTMGARPIALLDSLRFGPLSDARNRYLAGGVVAGIAGYGNAVGVPTVGGEFAVAECYSDNPLVNVLCVGIARSDRLFSARAEGVGNPVIYVGARTGRDGIHGAVMASEAFDESWQERRPAVQVGDPFKEKLLIEATLEVMETGSVIGIQDMGAAGLTCSTAEMAARAGTGMEIDLTTVPRREEGMSADELMLSESQERMLLVVRRGTEERVRAIFAKWDLDAVVIGHVTADPFLRVTEGSRVVASVPVKALVDDAPVYSRPAWPLPEYEENRRLDLSGLPLPKEYGSILLTLLASPTIGWKGRVWERYDHMLYLNTVVVPGSDAVVLRLPGGRRGIAVSCDGSGRYTFLDPYRGGALAVAEAARNVACSGAEPVALTNCVNFGNPERPEIMWQFAETLRGMRDAAIALGTPVTGGNVSFYNETTGRSIFPTPIVGVVGIVEEIAHVTRQGFTRAGDTILLLGETREELGGSEYLTLIHGRVQGEPPLPDLALEKAVQRVCLRAIREGLVHAAHDCSEGGLAVALAECCLSGREPLGAEVSLSGDVRPDALLFGESASRILLAVPEAHVPRVRATAEKERVPLSVLGRTGGDVLAVRGEGLSFSLPLSHLDEAWRGALGPVFPR